MGKLNNMIITSAGDSLLSKAMAGAAMSFTCGKTSGYKYPGDADFKELIKQEEVVQTAEVVVLIVSKTEISITIRFSNADVAKDYYIWNVGIYAADGENEILFRIIPFSEADEMPAFSGKDKGTTYIYNPSIVISDTSNITLSINQSGTATVEDINRIEYPEFLEAANRVTISSKESMQSILGKIKKWFSDLKSVAFTGSYRDLTDTPAQPESLRNPNPIKVNGKTYDGSVLVDVGSVSIAYGGTGATTAAAARDNLGLGDAATLNIANNSTTTSPGYALDARTANALQQRIDTHTGNAAVHITDAERTKWNGKQDKMTVDSALSTTSLNPVQNKVVTAKVNEINGNIGSCKFIAEGSGADTKYYIQTGADAASKKELGRAGVINLGTGTSFNVSNYPGFQKFTVQNFIVEIARIDGSCGVGGNSNSYSANPSGTYGSTISKSYNPATGIFSVGGTSISQTFHASGGSEVYVRGSFSASTPTVYLIN